MAKIINDFKILPIRFSSDHAGHQLFVKEHSIRHYDETKPTGRTLFVTNIPPYANERNLKRIFSVAGQIKSVFLQKNLSTEIENDTKSECGFKIGFIVYKERESLLKLLKLDSLDPLSIETKPVLTGLKKWITQYNLSICDHELLKTRINQTITKYEQKEEKRKDEEKVEEKQADEEGWTLVGRKGRNPGIPRTPGVQNKIIEKNKRKNKQKELKNFYTFQIKEQKLNTILALRKSFQQSKEKVEAMKKLRVFKPY